MDSGRQRGFGGGVRNVVAHVGEEGPAGFDAEGGFDGVRERGVGGVGFVAEGVEKEDVETFELCERRFRDVVVVGEVGGVAEAEAVDFLAAVHDGDGMDAEAEDEEGSFVDEMDVELRDVGAAVFDFEGVGEDAVDDGEGFGGGVDGDGALAVVEGADVVHAEDVVGVAVGVEDGVEAGDARGEHLGAEVGRGVDDDVARGGVWFVVTNQDGGAEAGVARVCGMADGAGTADGGDAGTGAGAQNPDGERHLGGGRILLWLRDFGLLLFSVVLLAGLNEAES